MYRVCSKPGCPAIHDGSNGSRCDEHRKQARQTRNRKTAVYKSAGHREFRRQVLERDQICVLCHLKPANVADHYPKSRDELVALGMDPNDPRHGRGLDADCHNKETAQHQPGGWNNRD